jgi:hypothetical protein
MILMSEDAREIISIQLIIFLNGDFGLTDHFTVSYKSYKTENATV